MTASNMAASGVPLVLLLVVSLSGSLCCCANQSSTEMGALAGTIKMIEDVEYGVVIDCVDMYKQPSLHHPLLKNHTIQMEPSSSLTTRQAEGKRKLNAGVHLVRPAWSMHGDQCPEGTIPVIRTDQNRHAAPVTVEGAPVVGFSQSTLNKTDFIRGLENALVFGTGKKYTGAHAHLNLWKPAVEANGKSNARMWLMASDPQFDGIDVISAGWMVDPNWMYPNKTVSVIFWMSSNENQTRGCYNLQCRGFIQVSRTFALGSPFHRVSTYDGTQYETEFTIQRDPLTGNWWLWIADMELGYWPSTLFAGLSKSADFVAWGGDVKSSSSTYDTQMGSGHFPGEGFGKSCYFRDLWYMLPDGTNIVHAEDLHPHATRPSCYDVKLAPEDEDFGVHMYFGGPGSSVKCQRD